MKRLSARWLALGASAAMLFAAGCGGGAGGGGEVPVVTPPPPVQPSETITITPPLFMRCVQTVPCSHTLQETGATGPVTWSLVGDQLPAGLTLDGTTGIISGTPSAFGTEVSIQVADAKASATQRFDIVIFEKLVINPVTPAAAHTNAPYSQTFTAQGSSIVATWSIVAGQLPPGLTFAMVQGNPDVAVISGTPTQVGTYSFTVQATDNTMPQTATLATSITVDSHLTITNAALKTGEQAQAYTDKFAAVNGTGPLTWSISGGLPAGLALNTSTGQVSGTPTQSGWFNYTVSVTDANAVPATDSAQGTLTIVPSVQIVGTLNPAYIETSYETFLSANGGFSPYSWAVSSGSLPPGLSLVGSSNEIIGTPTQLGSYNFVVQVSDSASPPAVATQAYTLNVTPTPLNLSANFVSPAPVNVLYHSQVAISGGTRPYSFSIASGALPPGLILDPGSGDVDGTPTKVGTYNFAAKVVDSSQPAQAATVNVFIQIRPGLGRNDSIATATPMGNSANVNPPIVLSISPYIDPVTAGTASPDTDYYRLVANAGSLVHVETFAQRSFGGILDTVIELLDQNGARLQACGAPAYTSECLNDNIDATTLDSALDLRVGGAAGTEKTFYAHVFDWRGDARPDMQYYLNVSGVNEPLRITTDLGGGATRGVSYQAQMASTGGTGSVTWSVSSGALPTGWTLTAAGLLSGTATTDGTYSFTIQAQDSGNPAQTARTAYTLSIAEPVTITSSPTLPNACVNRPYSFTVTTSGGLPPIQFIFNSPSFVSINLNPSTGVFSGTTDVTGTFTGTLGAYDSAQPPSAQSQTITLTVQNCS